jgi:hypothetical protein
MSQRLEKLDRLLEKTPRDPHELVHEEGPPPEPPKKEPDDDDIPF